MGSILEFNETFRELTKLSEVVNPANKTQVFNFVNVVGFVEAVWPNSSMVESFTMYEEETKNFRVRLGYCSIEQLKLNPQQNEIENMLLSPNNRSITYPPLTKGDLVCIRDLCLGTGPINIVVHPDQLFVSFHLFFSYKQINTFCF